ncbi:lectin-like domain-containing protein [Actinoplanes subtropicus]|uniref:choice-of-anchor D domain-containing protein n=1 Tax=Actinoplanes subtropicus TaxID=543632 RepID=UPI00068B39CC|nr:choice-of-anchor D domain-containing protein [Actinoplanes subtropicus]
MPASLPPDNLRTGWDRGEPALAPSTITSTTFGQLFATKVQGQVYAQPLVIGGTVVAGTEDNYVYGLDAATGAVKWQRSLGPSWPASAIGCADIAPTIGNTSTGVYDATTGHVYLTTKVDDGPDVLHPNWYLHAVEAGSGAERAGWPVKIVGTPSNDPAHPFQPYDVNQRPGLLLLDGSVYLAFGSMCDHGHYVGWVAGVHTGTRAISMWSDEAGVTSSGAGIWQAGGGLVSDGPGRIFLTTGNGVTAPDGPGGNPPQQLSESVVRLGVAADGTISARDFFSPANAAQLDRNDQDLGSGGPVALPAPYFGTAATPNLMVQIGKDGRLFLLDRDRLGGKNQKAGGGDDVVRVAGPYLGVWGHPAAYGGEGGFVYVVQNSGSMLAFKYGVDGSNRPTLSLAGNSSESFGYSSGSPIVTSDGTTPGTAVVWATNVDGSSGANGRLCAYDAVPADGHLTLLRSFPIGTGAKFSTPASADGRVYIGTRDGFVYGFGQPATAALQTAQTPFGDVLVSRTGTATVTATATRTVTVTAVSTSGPPFAATAPALPVTLTAGQTISVPVSFSPTSPGSFTGALRFAVIEAGVGQTLGAGLQGTAIKPGLTAMPATLDFGDIAVGTDKYLTVNITNTGTTDETVTAVTGPAAPFTVTGLPAVGTVLGPGQSVGASVTYRPEAAGADTSSITVTGPQGDATAALTGTGATGVAQLSITPESLSFGAVPIGGSATRTLAVANTGNLPVTVTKAAPPALPFVVNTPLPEGLVLNPEDTAQVDVTFAPTEAGSFSNAYVISSDDGHGAHDIPVLGTAAGLPGGTPLPTITQGGWFVNGSARIAGTEVILTPDAAGLAGSAVYSTPVPSDGLTASFTARIGGGSGGDGMTFALLAASGNTGRSLGGGGGGLGFAGLPGVAIALDTYGNGADPSNNFLGISTGATGGALTYIATTTNIPNLRSGPHGVTVTVSGTTITVFLDGAQRLSVDVPGLAPAVLPAFTGGTGTATDLHAVRDVAISSGGTKLPPPGTGWRFSGSADVAGSRVVLTPAATSRAGTALYTDPVATDGLTASFTLSIGGGTGADGAALVLLDPAQASPTSVGEAGGGLGFAGLAGVAVSFVTYPHDLLGIETGTAGGAPSVLASTTDVPDLRARSHDVVVSVGGTTISVAIDGTDVLSQAVPALQPTALVGFSAGTGSLTDVHGITAAQVVSGRTAVPAPGAGWSLNGSTTLSGGTVQLTAALAGQAGTAIYATPVPTAHLWATFTMAIGGGTGADGLTFMLLDPARNAPSAVGRNGAGLGFAGLTGVAVAFVTYPQGGVTSNNFAGIQTGTATGATFVATSTAVPDLRTGTHEVGVAVAGGSLVVAIDGSPLFTTPVAGIPATGLIGFSGATGGLTDVHTVSGLHIAY